ncbi:hypothetical protein JKP88DRAFT_255194, partial [Tribonema minus]
TRTAVTGSLVTYVSGNVFSCPAGTSGCDFSPPSSFKPSAGSSATQAECNQYSIVQGSPQVAKLVPFRFTALPTGFTSISSLQVKAGAAYCLCTSVKLNTNYFTAKSNKGTYYDLSGLTICGVRGTAQPSAAPDITSQPTTARPTSTPTSTPTAQPIANPTSTPTANPTTQPTASPTAAPTANPTSTPTANPTSTPTANPTSTPTATPTSTPTANPTSTPTANPTSTPTASPTRTPTAAGPTATPTINCSNLASKTCNTVVGTTPTTGTCYTTATAPNGTVGGPSADCGGVSRGFACYISSFSNGLCTGTPNGTCSCGKCGCYATFSGANCGFNNFQNPKPSGNIGNGGGCACEFNLQLLIHAPACFKKHWGFQMCSSEHWGFQTCSSECV